MRAIAREPGSALSVWGWGTSGLTSGVSNDRFVTDVVSYTGSTGSLYGREIEVFSFVFKAECFHQSDDVFP